MEFKKPGVFLLANLLLGALLGCSGDALPVLEASAPFVDFGEVLVGDSVEAQVTISNVGAAAAEQEQGWQQEGGSHCGVPTLAGPPCSRPGFGESGSTPSHE